MCVIFHSGWAKAEKRQGKVPSEQRTPHACGRRAAVDGVVGFQRRCALRCQHRRLHSGAQHQRLRRHEPPRVDIARRSVLREAVGDWRRSRNDDRACLHHSRSRYTLIIY